MALTEMVIMPGEDYQAICDSVRAKTGGTKLLKSGEVAPAIDGIEINTGIDTSDATATENDIAYGKTAYVNGEQIVGNIPADNYIDYDAAVWWDKSNKRLNLYSSPSERIIIGSSYEYEEGDEVHYYKDLADLYCSGEKLGNATIDDVKKGVTFTSQNGMKLTGNYEPQENTIPDENITALETDLAEGKIAYGVKSNGEKGEITGVLPVQGYNSIEENDNVYLSIYQGTLNVYTAPQKKFIFDPSIYEWNDLYTDASILGEAKPEDVRQGVFFSSKNGIQLQGTYVPDFSYSVNEVEGASYSFYLGEDGYYESNNKGQNSSIAICRVVFTIKKTCQIILKYINYAEQGCDYGVIGHLNVPLDFNLNGDTGAISLKSYNSANVQMFTFSEELQPGDYFFDIKFIKDVSVNNYNDSLKFKVGCILF